MLGEYDPLSPDAQLTRILPNLRRDRVRVTIVKLDTHDTSGTNTLIQAGLTVHRCPLRHAFDIRGWRELHRTLSAVQPAIVHAWGADAARVAAWLRRGTHRTIASVADQPGVGLNRWMTLRALQRCDRIVPMTWAEAARYRQLGISGDRLTIIGPCVRVTTSTRARESVVKELRLPPGARYIAVAGKLDSKSGIKSAIWNFDILRYDARDLHLVVLGDGPDRESLTTFGRALAFDDHRIHFIGTMSAVTDVFAHAELVWVVGEGGNALLALDAMAAGRPVVGWKTADLAELVVDGETGVLAEPVERARLSSATYPLIQRSDRSVILSQQARAHVAAHYTVERTVDRWARLYEELV